MTDEQKKAVAEAKRKLDAGEIDQDEHDRVVKQNQGGNQNQPASSNK